MSSPHRLVWNRPARVAGTPFGIPTFFTIRGFLRRKCILTGSRCSLTDPTVLSCFLRRVIAFVVPPRGIALHLDVLGLTFGLPVPHSGVIGVMPPWDDSQSRATPHKGLCTWHTDHPAQTWYRYARTFLCIRKACDMPGYKARTSYYGIYRPLENSCT